jgi:hypothetical protein
MYVKGTYGPSSGRRSYIDTVFIKIMHLHVWAIKSVRHQVDAIYSYCYCGCVPRGGIVWGVGRPGEVHRVGEVGEHLPGRLHQHPQHALLHIKALLIAANTIV